MRISFQFTLSLFLCIFCFNVQTLAKHTELAGDLPKVVTADKSPYLVIADVFVPAGKIVRIEAGTVFLFKNFTGIHVLGLLMVNGTERFPVIFTSENDRFVNSSGSLNPTPYDWNGIYIHKDGVGSDLQNIKVQYSVKGIISETKFIKLFNCHFFENGRSNLIIEGAEKTVLESVPFSYSLSIKDATIDGVPVKILQDPESGKRNSLRYSGLGVCAVGAVTGAFASMELKNSIKKYQEIQNTADTLMMMRTDGDQVWSKARSDIRKDLIWVISSFIFSAAGAITFTFSFTF